MGSGGLRDLGALRILGVEIDGSLVISRTRMTNEYKTKPAGAKPRNARRLHYPWDLGQRDSTEGFHYGTHQGRFLTISPT